MELLVGPDLRAGRVHSCIAAARPEVGPDQIKCDVGPARNTGGMATHTEWPGDRRRPYKRGKFAGCGNSCVSARS